MKKALFIVSLLLTLVQVSRAWDGSGTEACPSLTPDHVGRTVSADTASNSRQAAEPAFTVGFTGEGTEASPYLVGSTAEWLMLSADVASGNSYAGMVFRLTNDINTFGIAVGTDDQPFSGIFEVRRTIC